MTMASRDSDHPVTGLLTAVINEVTHLLRTEFRLARAEVGEKVGQASHAGMLIGIGAVLALPGLVILALAIVRWLAIAGVPEEWGLTIVAVVVLAIGAGLAIAGVNSLKGSSLVPQRTIDQVRADFSVAKEQV
jgi:uncharacterized membrane protein YqjE